MSFLAKLVSRLLPSTEDEFVAVGQRRNSVRLSFEVDIDVQVGATNLHAKLLNLTFTGLCVETSVPLQEGQELLLLRPEAGPPFRGTVLWTKVKDGGNHVSGIEAELDEDKLINSWLEPTLLQAGFMAEYLDEKRRLVRVPGKLQCKLLLESGEELGRGKMLDLSAGGALLEWPTQLEPGAKVLFEAARLDKPRPLSGVAMVTSSREKEGLWLCGLQFEKVDADAVRETMASMIHS